MSSSPLSKHTQIARHTGDTKTNLFLNSTRQQMHRKKAGSSASDVSVSSHSDGSNKSRTVATGAAKVFNKIVLKSLPSMIKVSAEANSTSFRISHTPDRSPVEMPLSGFPATNDEFDAAILRMNAQGNRNDLNGSVEHRGAVASAMKGCPQSTHSLRIQTARTGTGVADAEDDSAMPGTAVTSPGSTTMFLGPRGNGPLDTPEKGLGSPDSITSARDLGKHRPLARRVASDGVPPRPLSERPLIYSSMRTRPSLQTTHVTFSTQNVHSALRNSASGVGNGHNRTGSGDKIGRRRPRRPASADSTVSSSSEEADSVEKAPGRRVSSARDIRDSLQKTEGPEPVAAPEKSTCYFCQEDCQPGDSLCSKCQTRFQPQGDVSEYSESEYEDDTKVDEGPHFSPASDQPPATPSWRSSKRSSKRRNTRYPRPREKSRGCSEFSPVSQSQQLASRSASTSPTPHVALELKVVPPQDIKIHTVVSPTKSSPGDGRSAFHHIQQAMKPRDSISPDGPGRDSIRLGKVRSGEIRRVDIPDIIKAKLPTPNEKNLQVDPRGQRRNQRRGSFENWLRYYGEDDGGGERYNGSARSDPADLPSTGAGENSAVPATPGTYDRVTSIYDLYASLDDT